MKFLLPFCFFLNLITSVCRSEQGLGQIESVQTSTTVTGVSYEKGWAVDDLVMSFSNFKSGKLNALFEVVKVEEIERANRVFYRLTMRLQRSSKKSLVKRGDFFEKIDIQDYDRNYQGSTDLIFRIEDRRVSSRYKHLVTQGNAIGDTAETLWSWESALMVSRLFDDKKFLSSVILNFGLTNRITLATRLHTLQENPNLSVKTKFYQGEVNTLATGFTVQKITEEQAATININFMWDAVSSDTTISHTFLSIALRNDQQNSESSVFKSIGTSNVQTGYEFILKNWSRVLVGPNYNVENKVLGGYLAYVKIWNQIHLQIGVNTTNFQSLRFRADDGYSPFIEGYLRF